MLTHGQLERRHERRAARLVGDKRTSKAEFNKTRAAEERYARGLRKVAGHVGELARMFDPRSMEQVAALEKALNDYAELIEPWAETHAARMLADVTRRDEAVWAALSRDMSRSLREEIQSAPTGLFFRGMMQENVKLIKSLPREAAERVHHFVIEGLNNARRWEDVRDEIMRSGHVCKSRANLIARTETARASSGLVMARAVHVGSSGYIWQTARDNTVRESHRKMQGKFVKWSDPPVLDGLQGHAGQLPNCRCFPEPVIPEELQ